MVPLNPQCRRRYKIHSFPINEDKFIEYYPEVFEKLQEMFKFAWPHEFMSTIGNSTTCRRIKLTFYYKQKI